MLGCVRKGALSYITVFIFFNSSVNIKPNEKYNVAQATLSTHHGINKLNERQCSHTVTMGSLQNSHFGNTSLKRDELESAVPMLEIKIYHLRGTTYHGSQSVYAQNLQLYISHLSPSYLALSSLCLSLFHTQLDTQNVTHCCTL